ncbi:MAG: tRNA uridine-5-carboxymethylaminomethyl(34) synthesis enzyme MnmG [bacterium]
MEIYDIIVVGAGHAGCEAAVAAQTLGAKVLLITINMDRLAWMSCNPAIGGLAKGHLVKELAIFGGLMPKVIDSTGIQFRKLNSKKGRAVQSTRVQADKVLYSIEMKKEMSKYNNIHFFQAEVSSLIIKSNEIKGVNTCEGVSFFANMVIICPGTFLKGRLHYGSATVAGGRSGEKASEELSEFLAKETEHNIFRFKTGTPARLDARSIDFSTLLKQGHDEQVKGFSVEHVDNQIKKESCYLTRTNEQTHKVISENIGLSPVYSGKIESKGPRYCPSLEDKVVRFPDKLSHQVFLEPEGVDSVEYYANGVSTGLPIDIQELFYKTIKGLENVRIIRPAYAVEYDCVNPQDLDLSLESKKIKGLFFAGQVNGTSGYEEAGVQGFVAGINAARKIAGLPKIIFPRQDSYIGVLIDDIVTKGVDEPYRMFTSRSENRLYLREDNADYRLYGFANENKLIDESKYNKIKDKWESIHMVIELLAKTKIKPSPERNTLLRNLGSTELSNPISAKDLLKRPELNFKTLMAFISIDIPKEYGDEIEIEVKYEGYIKMVQNKERNTDDLESIKLSLETSYDDLKNLSVEVREKLNKVKPQTLGQASRISGVTPAAIDTLLIYKKRGLI